MSRSRTKILLNQRAHFLLLKRNKKNLDEKHLSIKLNIKIIGAIIIDTIWFLTYKSWMNKNTMYYQHVENLSHLLKSISHPIRLKILCLLENNEMTVGEIRNAVQTTHANISQHLTILRNQGIIDSRKDSNFIYNRIADERVIELIKAMHTLFCDMEK